MSTFESVKTLAYTFAPFLLPYLFRSFRKYQASTTTRRANRKPVPRRISLVANILLAATTIALISSCFAFSYENLITKTNSRIQTPQNVLWERVANIRPGRVLSPLDERLKDRLASTDGRCLYLIYGPDVTGNCPFCSSDEPRTFFYYALPTILGPHLLNLIVLGLSTSANVAGKEGNRFRTPVVLVGCVYVLAEIVVWLNYDWKSNMTSTVSANMFQFFGWVRLIRNVGFAIIDAGLAWFLWATATNRIMVITPSAKERLDAALQYLETTLSKTTAAKVIRSATFKDEQFHQKELEYWNEEEAKMEQIIASDTVQKAIQLARSHGRLDAEKLEQEAQGYVEIMLPVAGA
ncbi:MAG: hypothetical protein GOMPHAMPRED_007848 [Gomphillus americanus]|uniref:Uncharacterized protein n=1 Tax=Gomphillus americanus TaxID=1940652 RepID=A0A8H3EWX3_9LECA|nr:MAG: hypothetical protein GOMPHAMPRED_007848 [Gomphillus americanus]